MKHGLPLPWQEEGIELEEMPAKQLFLLSVGEQNNKYAAAVISGAGKYVSTAMATIPFALVQTAELQQPGFQAINNIRRDQSAALVVTSLPVMTPSLRTHALAALHSSCVLSSSSSLPRGEHRLPAGPLAHG